MIALTPVKNEHQLCGWFAKNKYTDDCPNKTKYFKLFKNIDIVLNL